MSSDARPCVDERYGPHTSAHPAVHPFVEAVEAVLRSTDTPDIPARVGEAMGPVLATEDLLCAALREPGTDTYRKHVLYACPEGRFTLLALVWLPGQGTDIHGHTAWGAVGVYEGHPNVTCYACAETGDGKHAATETKDIRCNPGDTAIVRPGLCDTHRIYNATDEPVITLHCYGLDLVVDPDAINIHLQLS